MINRRFDLSLLLLCFALMAANPAIAELSQKDILQSIDAHYPTVLAAQAAHEASKAQVQESQGAFDATIEQDAMGRLSGFYDGKQLDTRIVKPLAEFNSRLYGGYRLSDGSFPIYEDKRITNEAGVWLIGTQFSLLRDRMIDERRAKRNQALIQQDTAEIDVMLTRLTVQLEALTSYWTWVELGKQVEITDSMLTFLSEQQEGLEKRLKAGDVAEIALTENRQNIIRMESVLAAQRLSFQKASNNLSLYYRDSNGKPITAGMSVVPKSFPTISPEREKEKVISSIQQHPLLRKIHQDILLQEQQIELGENLLLPKADVTLEVSDDMGDGSPSRQPFETYVGLKVSVPLQRNMGQGKIKQAQAKIKQKYQELRFTEDRLKTQLLDALAALELTAETIQLTEEEIELAQLMQQSERQRYRKGDSDLFLINLRDQALAKARLEHVKAQSNYQRSLISLQTLTLANLLSPEVKE